MRQSGNRFDEEKIIRKLKYNTEDKNTYYRLKNRVIQDIGDSLALLHTHKNELYELQHYLTLYHIYHSKTLFKPCLFYLKMADIFYILSNSFIIFIYYFFNNRFNEELRKIFKKGKR